MKTRNQQTLRLLIRARDDFQSMRKRMDNRIGRKADGSLQNLKDNCRIISVDDAKEFSTISDEARKQEEYIAKLLKKILKRFPVYNNWLSNVKGVGEIASGWILGEIDIEKADAVSKIWQYCGMNPGMIRGQKSVKKSEYKPIMGQIVGELPETKDGEKRLRILTDTLIRGDKLSEGFLAPFNKRFRSALLGVLADGFIKAQSSYALEFYYPYKQRLENSSKPAGGEGNKAWKDVSKGHRDRAAKRYMIKMFLADLYVAWRTAEGLSVRKPYQEEYLGHVHQK